MERFKADTYGSDWHDISSVEYSIPEDIKQAIKDGVKILQENPVLKYVVVDGQAIANNLKTFSSTIDDDDKEEIYDDDIMSFKTDYHVITVFRSGSAWFKAHGKYDNESYYEFELEI